MIVYTLLISTSYLIAKDKLENVELELRYTALAFVMEIYVNVGIRHFDFAGSFYLLFDADILSNRR